MGLLHPLLGDLDGVPRYWLQVQPCPDHNVGSCLFLFQINKSFFFLVDCERYTKEKRTGFPLHRSFTDTYVSSFEPVVPEVRPPDANQVLLIYQINYVPSVPVVPSDFVSTGG